jgi:hypothetical protein
MEVLPMLDTETIFLASVFLKACPLTPQPSVGEFLHDFELEIDRTCRMLKFLGLVEDASSTLGFKPTHRLIDIVVDRMVRANTEGNNPVAKAEADCFGWLWQLVARDVGSEHNIEVNKDAKVVVLKAVNHEREDEQDGLDVEDDAEENDGPDEYWDEENDDDDQNDSSGQQFCCKVFVLLGLLKTFVLLGLLKTGDKKYVPTRLMANLFLESCFQQLSNKL